MKNKKYQAGGIVDEDELFADDSIPAMGDQNPPASTGGNLDGELAVDPEKSEEPGEPVVDPSTATGEPAPQTKPAIEVNPEGIAPPPPEPPAGEPAKEGEGEGKEGEGEAGQPSGKEGSDGDIDPNIELTGVEEFLTNYGINGGMIQFEDGTEARYSDLSAEEQANVLSTLVKDSVPSIEEKYNLDNSEIDLLNTIRETGKSTEDFINDIVDHRLQAVIAERESDSADYSQMAADALYVKNLKDAKPDLTDDQVAESLAKAKELDNYEVVVDGIRKGYIAEQTQKRSESQAKADEEFNKELEGQRKRIVSVAEGIQDVAGAVLNDEVKEFLLHDVMELNENKDPILMEKIFSDPETMLKVNWFMNYGEDYISNLNNYWKKQVSRAAKSGYERATRGMPGAPTQGAPASTTTSSDTGKATVQGKVVEDIPPADTGFGKIITEEELFG